VTLPPLTINLLLPAIPQGVLLGLLGFVGAMLGAAFSQWGISRQLKQDRQQKQLEREMSMRRDVYLSAIDSIALMQEHLAGFVRLDISDQELSAMSRGIGGSLSKVFLVGQFETVRAISSLYETYANAILHLAEKRMFMTVEAAKVADAKAKLDQAMQRWNQAAAAAQAAMQDGKGDRTESVGAELTEASRIVNEHQTAFTTVQRSVLTAQIVLVKEVSLSTLEFERTTRAAVLPVRRELHFEIDEASFARMSEEASARMRTNLEEWLERLSKIAGAASATEPSQVR